MTCPSCGAEIELPDRVRGIGICSQCLRSLVVDLEGEAEIVRVAVAEDTTVLNVAQLAKLREWRGAARKALV